MSHGGREFLQDLPLTSEPSLHNRPGVWLVSLEGLHPTSEVTHLARGQAAPLQRCPVNGPRCPGLAPEPLGFPSARCPREVASSRESALPPGGSAYTGGESDRFLLSGLHPPRPSRVPDEVTESKNPPSAPILLASPGFLPLPSAL